MSADPRDPGESIRLRDDTLRRRRPEQRANVDRPGELVPVDGGEPIPYETEPADEPQRESR
jgi:hypothetical protein